MIQPCGTAPCNDLHNFYRYQYKFLLYSLQVYKGELIGLYGDNSVTKVAIKTLKENATPKTQNDFRREVDLMSEMRHPNIVCLLGVCMRQEPMCMLFEFMVQGKCNSGSGTLWIFQTDRHTHKQSLMVIQLKFLRPIRF